MCYSALHYTIMLNPNYRFVIFDRYLFFEKILTRTAKSNQKHYGVMRSARKIPRRRFACF